MRRIFMVFAGVICLCGIIAAGVAAMGIQPSTASDSQKMDDAAKSAVSVLQDTEETKVYNNSGGSAYVDANADGICDNCGNCGGYADANADGICNNRGNCGNYVDADADGICDNRGTCSSDRNAAAGGSCNPNHRQTARYCGNGGNYGKN